MSTKKKVLKNIVWYLGNTFLIILIVVLLLVALFYVLPINDYPADTDKPVSGDYSKAVSKIQEVKNQDDSKISNECKSDFLDAGKKTEKVIILFHGFTNCPAQFSILKQDIAALGYNVYIPRLPKHGYKDVMTEDFKNLEGARLTAKVSESIDIATGLGDQIIILGISGSAVLTNWALYNEPEVDEAISISPLIVPVYFQPWNVRPFTKFIQTIPNIFIWWDSEAKNQRTEGPMYAYPRFSTRAMGEFLEIGIDLDKDLVRNKNQKKVDLSGKKLYLVTTSGDTAINNEAVYDHALYWRDQEGLTVKEFEFESSLGLSHDTIDPNNPQANPEVTYKKFLEYISE